MSSVYKEKLHKIIETIPEDKIPMIYKIIKLLQIELASDVKNSGARGSLAGIWKGSKIDDTLFKEARDSLYPYQD